MKLSMIKHLQGLRLLIWLLRAENTASYISYFDPDHIGTVATVLRTRGAPALNLYAAITVVLIGQHRYAITVVERVEPVGER